jgi:hypothetical protein
MDQSAMIDDMRCATRKIIAARLPIRMRTCPVGVVIEAPACVATGLAIPVAATLTWAMLDAAEAPLLRPVVDDLIVALKRATVLPAPFQPRRFDA